MNRIILIGNGFDLAHGYPTRYENFINWYWDKRVFSFHGNLTPLSEDCLCSIKLTPNNNESCWNIFAFNNSGFFDKNSMKIIKPSGKEIIKAIENEPELYEFKLSPFFKSICSAIESKGWVDIEREYYDLLRDAILRPENCNYTISELNCQLHHVKNLLAEYLSYVTTVDIKYDERIHQQIYGRIRENDICISQLHKYYDYVDHLIHHADDEYKFILGRYGLDKSDIYFNAKELQELQKDTKSGKIEDIYLKDLVLPENILFLNFNYTRVADIYGTKKVSIVNHIHGDLSNLDRIIFGYGDELDEDYKELLKQTDKESLKNIKSIKYLESSNYRDMLRFIESAPYQVYIMGHSCGNSDRTLLNTLFEHKNCVSIKPYYYQKEDGTDNFMEIVQNICRNFTDMKLMRDRVVNKTFCEPLPQSKNKCVDLTST